MCDWVSGYEELDPDSPVRRRNPRDATAGILSFLWPGAGHIYKGYPKLGGALAVGGVICLLWSITFFMFFGFLILPLYWTWVAVDSFLRKDAKYPEPAVS